MRNDIEPTWNVQNNGIHYGSVAKHLLNINYNL